VRIFGPSWYVGTFLGPLILGFGEHGLCLWWWSMLARGVVGSASRV
jgi:hypothetical protein